ncbi:MMPL family transporter [Skermanella mucosa]|uniref:MMPL family transporter n=1 Tax=Skermanella mucosa TaxID=1789672 RepID=UPI001E59E886|nr:MMPL family transporter [Skermanella mucosa]UEM18416.1 MMPL family transporter [Skermanella mucosa]
MQAGRLQTFGRHMLERWVTLVCRWPAATVLLSLVLAGAAGWYASTHLGINTSTTDMISPDVPFRQHTETYRKAFPFGDDQIVVVVDADGPERADAAALRLADLLRQRTDVLHGVEVPSADPYFDRYGLMFLKPEALQDLVTRLAGAQAALGLLSADPSLDGVAKMLDLVLGHADEGTPAELGRLLDSMAAATEQVAQGQPAHLSWTGLVAGDGLGRLGNRRFVLVRSVVDNSTLARGRPALDAVRAAIADLRGEEVGQGVTARVTGSVALRQTELDTVAAGATTASVLSFILVSLVLIVGIRSARMICAILVTLVIGLLWTSGLAALTVGQLNLISVTFAVMFFGLGDDFGGHLGLRYQEELVAGGTPARRGAERAAVAVGPALTLSTLCAAIGFVSFVPTDYRGLAEFGIISGMGMGVALFTSVTVLPALLTLLRPGPGTRSEARENIAFADWIDRNSRGVLAVGGLAFLAAAALVPQARLDANPLNLQDGTAEAVRTYRDLANSPDTSPYGVNILADDLDSANAAAERLRGLPGVGQVRTASSYIPAQQEEKLAAIGDLALILAPSLSAAGAPPPGDPVRALERLRAILSQHTDLPEASRFAEAVARLPAEPEAAAALDHALTGSLPALLDRLARGLEAERPATLEDLPPSLLRRWIADDGRARIEVLPDRDISDGRAMADFAGPILAIEPAAVGAPVTVTEASRIILASFGEAVAVTLGAIVLLLIVVQRSATGIALILAPLIVASVYTLAASVLLGMPFNFANIIVIPLLFGLGVSSSIHMVLRGQDLLGERAPGRRFGVDLLVTSTPRAVLLTALTTSTAFATLAVSSHQGLASMGILLAVAILATVVCALVLLPALMIQLERMRR